jgi:hypothetical protein
MSSSTYSVAKTFESIDFEKNIAVFSIVVVYHQESILAIVILPRQKIIMYNEFGVLLACENVGKFLAVCQVGA